MRSAQNNFGLSPHSPEEGSIPSLYGHEDIAQMLQISAHQVQRLAEIIKGLALCEAEPCN